MQIEISEKIPLQCRQKVYRPDTGQFLLSMIAGSEQAEDLSAPPNCGGYGRIHHFRRRVDIGWMDDPLPIDPACKALGLSYVDMLETQVFQLAVCNLHCWYCFVPTILKCAQAETSQWFTAEEMIDTFLKEKNHPCIIDLSGGNPELVPEWIIQTMKTLDKKGLSEKIYLWSDDTLTTDYTFQFLSKEDLSYFKNYRNYGKVCCFKGFDPASFSFNSGLPGNMFYKQFEHFHRYLELGLDLYGYVTITAEDYSGIEGRVDEFMDRLQTIHPLLPLRVVPLKIFQFSPTKTRTAEKHMRAIEQQSLAAVAWKKQLNSRFSTEQLETRISDINLYS